METLQHRSRNEFNGLLKTWNETFGRDGNSGKNKNRGRISNYKRLESFRTLRTANEKKSKSTRYRTCSDR